MIQRRYDDRLDHKYTQLILASTGLDLTLNLNPFHDDNIWTRLRITFVAAHLQVHL